MDSLINKVKTLLHSTNQNEQKISRFIVEQQFDLSELSATKVGMLLGISDSSVIRYAKSLGCSGFPDLKLKLAVQAHMHWKIQIKRSMPVLKQATPLHRLLKNPSICLSPL